MDESQQARRGFVLWRHQPASTPGNDIIDKALFKAVHDDDAPDQAWAIERAEAACSMGSSPDINPWMYLLLGDPQMRIRRENVGSGPAQLTTWNDGSDGATVIAQGGPAAPTAGQMRGLQLLPDLPGRDTRTSASWALGESPVPGIKVAVWKGIPPAPDATSSDESSELLDNRYTDAAGWARIPTPPLSVGMIHYTATDDREFSMADSLAVEGTTGVAGPGSMRSFASRRSRGHARRHRFEFSSALAAAGEVQVFGVDGRRVRTIPGRSRGPRSGVER